ncbi:MAG: P-loop domain-containing protein [Candidatus Aminicenantaceae bacterium]
MPGGREFSSEDASGSTSQAANIMESLEAGAKMLLIDEDTSATNFMIRDHRMQELVPKSQEPITPFIDKVRQLHRGRGVSTVLVIGGSGDYFDVADRVICRKEYLPYDLTPEARAIAQKYRTERRPEGGDEFGHSTPRVPLGHSLNPRRGRKPVKVGAKGLRTVSFGREHIDLSAVEQVADASQTRAIAQALVAAKSYMNGRRPQPPPHASSPIS